MPLTLPVNTVAECLRTDCYILGDKKKLCFVKTGAWNQCAVGSCCIIMPVTLRSSSRCSVLQPVSTTI